MFGMISIKKCLHTVFVAQGLMLFSADFSGEETLCIDVALLLERSSSSAVSSRRHGQSAFLTNDNERSILINGSSLAAIV